MANISVEDVFWLLEEIQECKELKFTLRSSMTAAAVTAVSAGAGGLLGGKSGLIVGGAIGALSSFLFSPDYKSLPAILQEMTDKEKEKLANIVKNILLNYGINVLNNYAIANKIDPNLVKAIRAAVTNFVESKGYERA